MKKDLSTAPGPDAPLIGRRQALQLFGLIGAGGAMAAKAWGSSGREAAPSDPVPAALPAADFALLRRLTEIIIPRTETAGAIEAGVPEFIAAVLPSMSGEEMALMAENVDLTSDNPPVLFADGFRWLDDCARTAHGRAFLELAEPRQSALLSSLYAAAETGKPVGRGPQFLRALKALTVEGYYTSKEGLIDELGYKGNRPNFSFRPTPENDLPRLDPSAPMAKALGYVEDTAGFEPNKEPLFKPGSRCLNCASLQAAPSNGDYAPCAIFAGAGVRKNGWCRAWAAKA